MPDVNDMELVREFALRNSEPAFAELVRRHINLVYSVALRYVGNSHDAEDVTQAVLIILARKAAGLRSATILTGWLYETTRFTALKSMQTRTRRQLREQEAQMLPMPENLETENVWRRLGPLLEEAMARLSERERALVALRFFENKSGAETAAILGIGEWAAHKRTARAIEKLRSFFGKRGVVVPAAILTAAISANSVHAAPVGLANSVTAAALVKGATASASTLTLIQGALKVMAWTKAQAAVTAGIVAVSLMAPFIFEHQAQGRLRALDDLLQTQGAQIKARKADNDALAKSAANVSLSQKQVADLQKLRAEAPSLESGAKSAVQTREENRRLQKDLNPRTAMQIKEEAMAKINYSKNWAIAFYQFAQKNQGQFPSNFDQAAEFLPDEAKKETKVTTDQFDIVFAGSPASLTNARDIIAIREKDAWPTAKGQWAKAYTFVDGHSTIHSEPVNNFTAYESEHMLTQPANP